MAGEPIDMRQMHTLQGGGGGGGRMSCTI